MNINKKYIIIFGTLILSLIVITGAVTYYKEKGVQTQILDVKQPVLSFSQDHPVGFSEVLGFINECRGPALFSGIEELKIKEIKEVACLIVENTSKIHPSSNPYVSVFSSLDSITSFRPDIYIGISVDLKDVIRKFDPSLLEKEKLYFCNISEPSWEDRLYLQIAPEQNLFFPEGGVCCAGIEMNNDRSISFSGFVPQAESLNIKHYLVDEQTVSDVMNKQSFSEIKDILNGYPIIWQMEKPIVP